MSNKVQLLFASEFKRNIRQLAKKYRNIKNDLTPLLQALENGETPGEQIQGTGATLFKTRIKNSNNNKGKSGGYRVIYFIRQKNQTILLSAYSKSQQSDISSEFLYKLVEKYKL